MAQIELTQAQRERARRLIRPWLPTLLRTAQCLTQHQQEAEDLVQDAVVKAMRATDSFEDGTNERAWLLTILRRAHIDRGRSAQRRPLQLSLDSDEGVEPEAQDGDDEAAGKYDQQWDEPEALMNRFEDEQLIEALQQLPDDTRWTLLLVDVEQMEHTDAARVLGVAEGTIKSRAHRGRKLLRDQLYEWAQTRGWIAKEETTRQS